MIWALLFMFLVGGSAGDGWVHDISKSVKEHVQNPAAAKEIISLNKQMLKEEGVFRKESNEAHKRLAKINGNRLASEAEMMEVFASLDARRAEARERILVHRFQMRGLMSAEEWTQVFAAEHPEK
jgi:hypothetical protein